MYHVLNKGKVCFRLWRKLPYPLNRSSFSNFESAVHFALYGGFAITASNVWPKRLDFPTCHHYVYRNFHNVHHVITCSCALSCMWYCYVLDRNNDTLAFLYLHVTVMNLNHMLGHIHDVIYLYRL